MDDMLKRITGCIGSRHGAKKELADHLGIHPNVITNWLNGRNKSYRRYLPEIAAYYGVTVEYLKGEDSSNQAETPPALTKKDERDIERKLSETLNALGGQDGLMFDGEPLDDMTRELLEASLRNSLEMAKKIAKQKYTPKKYRKD